MGQDSVKLMCPNLRCRTLLSVPATARGKTVSCRQCGSHIRVPLLSESRRQKPAPPPAEPAQDQTTASN